VVTDGREEAPVVDLTVTEEQEMLRTTVRRLLAEHAPLDRLRSVADGEQGPDPALWKRLIELGLPALAVPVEHGGLGQGAADVAIVAEEMGRALGLAPLLSAVALATPALLASGDEAVCHEVLPLVASGEAIVVLASTEADGRWAPEAPTTTATSGGGGWVLSGRKCFVVDGAGADLVLVLAATPAGSGLFLVDAHGEGVDRREMRLLDPSRPVAEVKLTDAPARLVGSEGGGPGIMDRVTSTVALVTAAEAVGGMRACLDLSVEHAKQRVQFGRPIGSFQAIAHTCVDMLQRVEFAASAVQYAAAARDQVAPDADLATRVAAAYCSRGFHWVTKETIQVHGGLGFTWDHDAHLFYRRARSAEQLFTRRSDHVDAVTRLVGL
jgi:alkylation response protein AidB-like acyl-CoA dehydrogenase